MAKAVSTASLQGRPAFLPAGGTKWTLWLQVGVIAAAVFVIYGPVVHGDWLWDDSVDITNNAITQRPTGLWNIWFEPGSQRDYYPIKASVQWVQWHLWGMDTRGYHLTNIFLHGLNALLVWRLLGRFKLKFAWLGGLLFAIHPANVESVAWIAELKNTLSLTPFLVATIAWIDYEETGRRRDYALALGFFLIAMLCKTAMVMFPFVLLLYAWWKRGTITWSNLKVTAPFFAISLVLGLVTIWCETWYSNLHHREIHFVHLGLLSRFALAGLSLAFYGSTAIWPVNLSVAYSQWKIDPPSGEQFLPWLVFLGLFFWLWAHRSSWGKHALLGLGFFVINLVPVLGFIPTAFMRLIYVMDHFLYIPIIGIIGLAVAGWEILENRLSQVPRYFVTGGVVLILGLLTWESCSYAKIFTNGMTLWAYVLKRNPDSLQGHYNFGNALFKEGRWNEAIGQYQAALELDSAYIDARYNLGVALFQIGRVDDALAQFQEVVRLKPSDREAQATLAKVKALSRPAQNGR